MSPTVLVVDDEAPIRSILAAYLRGEGYAVVEASTGAQALAALAVEPPQLVLLDIGLPDVDGLEVLRRLRTFSDVYVILVTARAEEVDKLVGLGVGADDYVTKPFSPREVVARVKAVLRRVREPGTPVADDGVHRFGDLVVDETRREVTLRGAPVALSTLDFDLLVVLARSPGRVFSRVQLLEKVWGYDFFGDERVVDVHVRTMRRALADDASDPTMIGTVRGVGYKFLLEPTGRTP
ncbi:MAG TPA: response regulator transcription factor [Nocardioides sp.]|uniref:response regulator transcription factor n=1 Tax=Nocardioides sp. TaxID=35761 RepID=UPI002BAD2264|nr:response regulator transcription factor [Nocardioides sp.]HQR25630.1 response regulator transcription factor [Nocardioides sp.]